MRIRPPPMPAAEDVPFINLFPRVAVIVVNWNRRDLLREALDSLLRQDYPAEAVEIIVVDNGSDDGSAELVASRYPQVRLLRNQENRGFCAANNQGIQAASASAYIALLNNDAVADPHWLSAMVELAGKHPEAGMIAAKIVVHDQPEIIDKAGHVIYWDGQNRGRGAGERDEGQYDHTEEVLWPDGCAALYRRELLAELGGFDEDFFAYADDAELGLRARLAGWTCWYAPGAVVRHRRGATLGLDNLRRIELIERNRIWLVAKLFPWSLLWLNAIFYLARIAAGAWAATQGQGEAARFPGLAGKLRVARALLRGGLQALPLVPKMIAKRRSLIRRMTASQILKLLWRHRICLRQLSRQAAPW